MPFVNMSCVWCGGMGVSACVCVCVCVRVGMFGIIACLQECLLLLSYAVIVIAVLVGGEKKTPICRMLLIYL
ncbi:hypothetical protein BKA57DRAFT_270764 [Linnemannia elongata]|nr:hypothetical protein BKA57DRAFT_270764 [Linnemannia elongata]